MLEVSYLLILGSLLFTFSSYYFLKTHLVEWGCRTFLKGRVKVVRRGDDGAVNTLSGESSALVITDHDNKAKKLEENLTIVTRGDLAEIAQL